MRKATFLVTAIALVAAVFAVQAFAATTSVAWKVGTKKSITIKRGGTVKWVWADGSPHNVKGPGFTSKVLSGRGKSFSHRFNSKGRFVIVCQVHPTTMKTIVTVR